MASYIQILNCSPIFSWLRPMICWSYMGLAWRKLIHTMELGSSNISCDIWLCTYGFRETCNICGWTGPLATIPNPYSIIGVICTWYPWYMKTCGNLEKFWVVLRQLMWWTLLRFLKKCHPSWKMILHLHNSELGSYTIGIIRRHMFLRTTYITWSPCIDTTSLIWL